MSVINPETPLMVYTYDAHRCLPAPGPLSEDYQNQWFDALKAADIKAQALPISYIPEKDAIIANSAGLLVLNNYGQMDVKKRSSLEKNAIFEVRDHDLYRHTDPFAHTGKPVFALQHPKWEKYLRDRRPYTLIRRNIPKGIIAVRQALEQIIEGDNNGNNER